MQASEDLFMDLDETPSKRSRDTPSSTQQSDFANPDGFVQRAQNVSVPLPRTPEQHVPALETPFQPVPHGNVALVTPPLFRSDEAMPSTPSFHCFPGGETAPVTPRVKNSKFAEPVPPFSVPSSHPMPSTSAIPSTLPTDTQSDDPFQFADPSVTAPLSCRSPILDTTTVTIFNRVEFASLLRIWNPMRIVCAWMLANEQFLMWSHDVAFGSECCKPLTIFKSCGNSGKCEDVLLTRRAANKEVQYDALVKSQQERVDVATTREWDKWDEFGVTKFLSKKQLNDIMKRNPDQKIVGTRWVFTEKVIQGKPDYEARLVVQGCQEDKGYIRTDAPTGSRDAFFMTLSAAAHDGWDYNVFDAQSAYLLSDGIERLLLLRMPHKNPPPETKPGQVFVATGSIYGTRDAGRAWYEHRKKVLEAAGFVESWLEQGLYFLHGPSGCRAHACR